MTAIPVRGAQAKAKRFARGAAALAVFGALASFGALAPTLAQAATADAAHVYNPHLRPVSHI